ncbi:hypothetical protein FQN54_004247 [Arachnomyces sp. PD_36]|nr:hypothetical protein FQN54_004247 [Arachnomyces sp. PD_36]
MAGKAKGRSKRHQVPTAFVAKRQWATSQPDGPNTTKLCQDRDAPRLTMQQEARNTERHTISRSNLQLRHHQVAFVSAGNMHRDDLDDPALENMSQSMKELNTSKLEPSVETATENEPLSGLVSADVNMAHASPSPNQQSQASADDTQDMQGDPFFVDSTGDTTGGNTTQSKPKYSRPLSPIPTDSSEDEVVFVGRNKLKAGQTLADRRKTHTTELEVQTTERSTTDAYTIEVSEEAQVPVPDDEDLEVEGNSEIFLSLGGKSRRRRGRGRKARQRQQEMNDEDLILADYIANMHDEESSEDQPGESGTLAEVISRADAAQFEKCHPVSQTRISEEHKQQSFSWSSNDIDDLGDLSTSDEVPSEVGHILSKRQRQVGVQYLVTGKDQILDEARWILKEHLIMVGASEQIKAFDEKKALLPDSVADSDDSESTSTDRELDELSGHEGVSDENVLSKGNLEKLSDEQIARLLNRQERYGLAADDWAWGDGSGDSDVGQTAGPDFQSRPSRKGKKGNRRANFPSAAAFADALDQDPYHGFDVMDFDRPSLRRKPKGGRQALDFGLSDSELEWGLQEAWENDRSKKKAKKQAREEMRAQGLLGKQSKMNMGSGHSGPMSTDDFKDEIRNFLLSSSESLSLPPMDKKARKLVHDLANAVSLKSQSRGNGASRFPMLYKTARTPSFNKTSIRDVDRIFSAGRFMRRVGGRAGFERSAGKPVKSRRSGANAGASYMDGDVVGASAPEIGVENRGRAMLEKMGWSTGTALGATDNKGILQPLAQVVKNTKAGLG